MLFWGNMKHTYSDKELHLISDYYKAKLAAPQVKSIEDIKKSPADVLLSYYIANDNPSRERLVLDMIDLDTLTEKLVKHLPKEIPESELPETMGSYALFSDLMVNVLPQCVDKTKKVFIFGGDKEKIGMIGTAIPSEYVFPSGLTQRYFSITDEMPMNMPIFMGAFGDYPSRIYLRESSIKLMSVLNFIKAVKDPQHSYKKYSPEFDAYLPAILIAHEKCELDLINSGKIPERRDHLELMVEKQSIKFLKENGVDQKFYELYHLLRAGKHKKNIIDISRAVVNSGFKPTESIRAF